MSDLGTGNERQGGGSGGDGYGDGASDRVAQNIVAIFHASFHPTKGNTIDWSLTSPTSSSSSSKKPPPSIDLSGVEFSVLPSGLHLVERDVVYFAHGGHAGLAVFRRRPTRNKQHRGFRLASLGILLEECPRPRPWMHLEDLRRLADEVYKDANRRERELERGEVGEGSTADLLGLGSPGDLTEKDFEPARIWFERRVKNKEDSKGAMGPLDVWSGWSEELDGTFASESTPTHHLPHLLRILGLSSLTLYKFVLSRRRILIYTLPPVEVAGVLAWIAADLCRDHHMGARSKSHPQAYGVPMPSLFSSKNKPRSAKDDSEEHRSTDGGDEYSESPTVLGMITLSDIPKLEEESAKGRGWIACTTDAIFMEKPQYYDLIVDLTTSTPDRNSRPSMYMSKNASSSSSTSSSGPGSGIAVRKKKEKWKLESVRFTWSDVKLWTELDRILKLDSSQSSFHAHSHKHSDLAACCLPKSPISPTPGTSTQNIWADAFRLYEDVCLMCATLWMGLGTWRSNSRQSFATRDVDFDGHGQGKRTREWGSAREPGDEDWSMEGTHMRALGMGIEGNPALRRKDKDLDKAKDKDRDKVKETKIRAVGLGIEGRPSTKSRSKSSSTSEHTRKVSGSSTLSGKAPKMGSSVRYVEAISEVESENQTENENENQDQQEGEEGYVGMAEVAEIEGEMRRQNLQTTLALLQTFHANTVFWLSKLRELIPPPSMSPTPTSRTPGSAAYNRLRSTDQNQLVEYEQEGEDDEEISTITITARDLLSLELGVLSELDARFVEWLVEAEGYASASGQPSPPPSRQVAKKGQDGLRRRRVVVKRGWQELFGLLLGLK